MAWIEHYNTHEGEKKFDRNAPANEHVNRFYKSKKNEYFQR